jgi:segregation and condensation protein B
MSNLKYKLEALLFSSARSMKVDELAHLTKSTPAEVREKVNELKIDYEARDSSITLIDEGDAFKLNVKSEHIPVIQQIVTETELSKTLMETLAIIAFKYPIKQSELIKLRTNKAYDHLSQLEDMGYITRQKYGRTKLIKLTPKFFEYFDLPAEKLKEKFESFEGIAKAIKEKEEEVRSINEEIKKKAKEAGKKEVDLIDEKGHKKKLEVFEEPKEEIQKEVQKIEPIKEEIGDLEVVDVEEKEEEEQEEHMEEPEQEPFEEEPSPIKINEEMGKGVVEHIRKMVKPDEPVKTYSSMAEEIADEFAKKEKTPDEVERDVDSKVEQLLHPAPFKEKYSRLEEEAGSTEEIEEKEHEESEEQQESDAEPIDKSEETKEENEETQALNERDEEEKEESEDTKDESKQEGKENPKEEPQEEPDNIDKEK